MLQACWMLAKGVLHGQRKTGDCTIAIARISLPFGAGYFDAKGGHFDPFRRDSCHVIRSKIRLNLTFGLHDVAEAGENNASPLGTACQCRNDWAKAKLRLL